jgi:hypothetical protein
MVSQTETRRGDVTRVSGYGFQLNGQTRWYNLSKFVPGLALPAVGDAIEVSLSRGYVVQITRRIDCPALDPGSAAPPEHQPTVQVCAPLTESDELPFEPPVDPPVVDPDTRPLDESLVDTPEASPADGAVWDGMPFGVSDPPSLPQQGSQVVRMHAITSAVAVLQSGGRPCAIDEVLQLAARLEAWVNR